MMGPVWGEQIRSPIADNDVVALQQTHRLYECGHVLRADSRLKGWRHLLMLDYHSPSFSATFAPARDHLLLFMQRGTAQMTCTVGGRRVSKTVRPGHMNFIPAGAEVEAKIEGSLDTYQLYASAAMIHKVLEEYGYDHDLALEPQLVMHDQLLAGLVQACAAAMHEPERHAQAYVDRLSWALGAHLVRICYKKPTSQNGLSGKMPVERLRAIDDYIDAHLAFDIGVSDLAKAAGYSPIYFSRLFRESVGMPPYQYLLQKRVEAVRNALFSSARLADIALATGFCNQEHMTRAFRQHHNMTPGRYRREQAGLDAPED